MKKIFTSLFCLLMISFLSFGQKTDKQEVEFSYTQLPLKPLNKAIKNYTSEVVLVYEAEILEKEKRYSDEYEIDKKNYDIKVASLREAYVTDSLNWLDEKKVAEFDYKMAMQNWTDAWNKKSTAEKIVENKILHENNKPVMKLRAMPYYNKPTEPSLLTFKHQKVFDKKQLASLLKIEGYKSGTEGAVKITITLLGFENVGPELKSSESSYFDSKTNSTVKETSYWYETSYKHPMNLKIETPSEGVIFDEALPKLGEYTIAKTNSNKHSAPSIDRDAYKAELQDKIVAENIKYINEYLASNYGFHAAKRTGIIYRVESKKMNFDDYQLAYENAISGYNMLSSNKEGAKDKLKAAIAIWEKALTEYNPSEKGGRIDSDVNIVTRFNLFEAYMWVDEFNGAEDQLSKIIGLKPSRKEEKLVEEYRIFLKDMKSRVEANK